MIIVTILLSLHVTLVLSQDVSTTTKTYDLEVPGSKPIRIVEGEPLWHTTTSTAKPETRFEHRSFSFTTDQTASLKSPLEDNDENNDSADALQKFLTRYAESVKNKKKNKFVTQDMESVELITKPSFTSEDISDSSESFERSKSWDLLHFQKHNHPYDDKKGWVSMEPVPWSVSKISKWQSSHKPVSQKPWDSDYDSSIENDRYSDKNRWPPLKKPSYSNQNHPQNYQIYYLDEDNGNHYNSKPSQIITASNSKPFAIYNQKVQSSPSNHYQHDENCDHNNRKYGDIITDGLPPNFPQPYSDSLNRRRGTEIYSDAHPFSGEGDWVLLSTTKGYKYPHHRQRSLQIKSDSIGAHHGVKLTVLPPLKNSKVNMTTSHGGLLQVESTFESVEQAKNQFLKKQRLKNKKSQHKVSGNKPQQNYGQIVAPATVTTTNTRSTVPDTSAVLAAVGAGMIPATMAMLVPMAMSGRRKRETRSKLMEITLPRNI